MTSISPHCNFSSSLYNFDVQGKTNRVIADSLCFPNKQGVGGWGNGVTLFLRSEMLKGLGKGPPGRTHSLFLTSSAQGLLSNHFLITKYCIFTQVLLCFNCLEAVTGSKAVGLSLGDVVQLQSDRTAPARKGGEKGSSAINTEVTPECTIYIHKHIRGVGLWKCAPGTQSDPEDCCEGEGSPDVHTDSKFNKAVWPKEQGTSWTTSTKQALHIWHHLKICRHIMWISTGYLLGGQITWESLPPYFLSWPKYPSPKIQMQNAKERTITTIYA